MDFSKQKAEDWLDDLKTVGNYAAEKIGSVIKDMPIVKSLDAIATNPTPQEIGAQVYNLGSAISENAREATKDPIGAAVNYGPMGIISKRFFRHSNSVTGETDVPWQMFSDDESKIIGAYGNHRFTTTNVEGKVIHAEDIKKDIEKLFTERPDIIESYQSTPEDIVKGVNPKQIVNSAELWDSPDLVQEIWDNILEPRNISAVETKDGIIVFDPKYIKKERDIINAEDFLDQ